MTKTPIVQIESLHSPALRYFDAVRRHGTMRAAARALNVASPAVTRQILKVEKSVGAPLFLRLSSGLKLTAAGEIFADHANLVLRDAHRATYEIESIFGLERGHLSLVTVEAAITSFLPSLLADFQEKYPGVNVQIETTGSLDIPDMVTSGKFDLGIAFSAPPQKNLLKVISADFKIGAIVAASHPLAANSKIDFASCLKYPIVLADGNIATQKLMLPLIEKNKLTMHSILKTDSLELMRNLSRNGKHVMFGTKLNFENNNDNVKLVHIPLTDGGGVYAELGVFTLKNGKPEPATGRFLSLCTDALEKFL